MTRRPRSALPLPGYTLRKLIKSGIAYLLQRADVGA